MCSVVWMSITEKSGIGCSGGTKLGLADFNNNNNHLLSSYFWSNVHRIWSNECLDGVDFIAMVNSIIDNNTRKDKDCFYILYNIRCR